jgi:hypothetical protein
MLLKQTSIGYVLLLGIVSRMSVTVQVGLHNKPKVEVHPGHKLTGPKEEEEEEEQYR